MCQRLKSGALGDAGAFDAVLRIVRGPDLLERCLGDDDFCVAVRMWAVVPGPLEAAYARSIQ
jgi:hypothetical protein